MEKVTGLMALAAFGQADAEYNTYPNYSLYDKPIQKVSIVFYV